MNALMRDLEQLCRRVERNAVSSSQDDPYRQHYHLMPLLGWQSDINGLCQFQGWYHVFFQYSPFNPEGGLKLWGHYRSRDLLHWEYLSPPIWPDTRRDVHGIYSGSALVEDDTMFLYYTGNVKRPGNDYDYITHGREQNVMLVSSEDGVNFSQKSVLLTNEDYLSCYTLHVRDPMVWKEDNLYYMILGARRKDNVGEALVLFSSDRTHFVPLNRITSREPFGHMWECPSLFQLPGQPENQWVLSISPQGVKTDGIKWQNIYQSGYFLLNGNFRTQDYTLSEFHEWDQGFDFYAPQSMVDDQGRRLLMVWMGLHDTQYDNSPTLSRGWQHCQGIPRVLQYRSGKLYQSPIPELQQLRKSRYHYAVSSTFSTSLPRAAELQLNLEYYEDSFSLLLYGGLELRYSKHAGIFELRFRNPKLGCRRDSRSVEIGPIQQMRIFLDHSSVECFLNDGEEVFSTRFYPTEEACECAISGDKLIGTLTVYQMGKLDVVNKNI